LHASASMSAGVGCEHRAWREAVVGGECGEWSTEKVLTILWRDYCIGNALVLKRLQNICIVQLLSSSANFHSSITFFF